MPDDEPRPVLRIFFSSTSEDLGEHRDAVTAAILRVGDLPVTMETFGADPGSPVEVCLERVRGCDALVVLVGERIGWVPTSAEGGEDGRSITWLEVLGGTIDPWTDELLFGTGELLRDGARDDLIAIGLIDAETENALGKTFDASWRRESA
jgi:hypothetical protein